MKKLLLSAIATLAMGSGLQAQTYSTVAVTGYNADVVADGTGTVVSNTSIDVDGVNFNFMAEGYTNPANQTTTRGLPASGIITTAVAATPGLTYQLAPYTVNNSLRINGSGTAALTFPTGIIAEKIYVLATSGSGTSITTMTVTFADATTQQFTQTINDWFGGSGFAIQGIGRVNRNDNGIDNNANDPRLYQYELSLNIGNITKAIQSISFSNAGSVLNVMGISVKNSASPVLLDAGVIAVSAPASPVLQNISQPVQVTLVNQGTTPLTSATITWTVDGLAQPSFAWTGTLALNQTATVTLGNFTFSPGSHTLNACATNPNNGTDGFTANDCSQVTLNSCETFAGAYTINKNNPASATNFQSFGAVATALSGCGITGPVTFTVAAGSGPYTEQVEFMPVPGASAINTITFNGNNDTIQAAPTSGARHIIKMNGADYFTISNLTILSTTVASGFGWGIHFINGADNNTISNNIITINSTSTTLANSGGIVFSNASSSATTTGNNGSNNVISGNIINGGYKGISIYGLATSIGSNQLLNNTVKNFYAIGIHLNATNGTLVEGNNLSRPDRSGVNSTSEMVTISGGTRSSLIQQNRLHTSHGTATSGTIYGFYSNSNDTPAGAENIIRNNLVYNLNTTGTVYGIHNVGSDGSHYYHNTFNLDFPGSGTVRGFNQTTAAVNVKFKNNIVNVVGGTAGAKHAIYYNTLATPTTPVDIESNNNVLFVTGGANTSGIGYHGSNRVTLTDLQTATGNDAASISVDPAFTSITNADFLPTATAINNIGMPVNPPVTHDITGALRNPVTPDPGAYEMGVFTPATNDVGITAITAPNSGCGLTNQEVITVTIENFGTAALANIPVSYTFNGGPAVNETAAASIAPGATGTYSFTATANLSAPGSYVIVANTNLTGDALASNNSFTETVVHLAPAATPTVTAGGPITFCAGGSVVLTAASTTTGATYNWFLNGTAITGATAATYTANAAGSYTAVATANGCSSAASAATSVTVNAAPTTPVTNTGGTSASFCAGGSVTISVTTPVTGVTYEWFNNGTAIPGATGTSYTANAAGSYTVTATSGGCSASSAATVVTVNATPAVPTITAGGPTAICSGNSVTLTAASTATGATYTWFNNGTLIPGATSATYTATMAGNYTAVASANNCSSAASAASAVTVTAAPAVPTVTAGGPITFCSGGSVTLTAASSTTGATYQWMLNGTAIPAATSATYAANAAGSYTVMASAGTCSATSTATVVTVNVTPATPVITQNGFVLTSGSAAGNQWYLNGAPITGATSTTYTSTANGAYTVIVTTNGCSSAASNVVTIINTGLKADQLIAVSVFPNPSNGAFNVILPAGQTYEMQVTDLTGKLILNQKTSEAKMMLNLPQVAKGMYFLKLASEGKTATVKLIVE